MATSSRSNQRQPEESVTSQVEEKIVKVNGDVAIRRYTKGRFLGKGGFARVYEIVNNDTAKHYAGKIVQKASLTKSRAK
jgi:polo-like kinase 1